ncbi:MAG: cytochrome o ubiquinol oxidase subunit IV [Candidatus Liptonbacteria bacterium]|nr:cytochrome o ubiquinol oxidase subunit IV [Candidatus Liptonbacteria bacterium]
MKSYLTGFILSIVLTVAAYFAVAEQLFVGQMLVVAIIGLALAQFVVQLLFFLHLGKGTDSRWNLVVLLSAISIVLILVIGSLWIMHHLNYNMTLPAPLDSHYLINQ